MFRDDYANLFERINAVLDDEPLPPINVVKEIESDKIDVSISATNKLISTAISLKPNSVFQSSITASSDLSSELEAKFEPSDALSATLTTEIEPIYDQTLEEAYKGERGTFEEMSTNERIQLNARTARSSTNFLYNERGKICANSSLIEIRGLQLGYEVVNVKSRDVKLCAAGAAFKRGKYEFVAQANSTETAAIGALVNGGNSAYACKIQLGKGDIEGQIGLLKGVGNGEIQVSIDSEKAISASVKTMFGPGQIEAKTEFKLNGDAECGLQLII